MTNLSEKTVKELKQMIKDEGIFGYSRLKKPQLIQVLNELSNTNISSSDAKLIQEFEQICTLDGNKRCRIRRPNGTFLYHDYKTMKL